MYLKTFKTSAGLLVLILLCGGPASVRGNPEKSFDGKPEKAGTPPRYLGPVDALAPLETPEIYRHGSRKSRKVALTIDDGWVDDKPLLDLLVKYKIPCTVFIPGKVLQGRPEWVKKLDRLGFEVANHTYGHKLLTHMSDEEIEVDVLKAQTLITELTGKIYPYLRPSGGAVDERVLRVLARLGYIVIMWENDVLGYWKDRPIETQFKYIRENRRNGNIILSHFGSALRTTEVLKVIIPEMLAEGYEFVTITELLKEMKNSEVP
jgi:peptidoglycan/xylan/chitin deacetylase (PgdA/CDA1 family)